MPKYNLFKILLLLLIVQKQNQAHKVPALLIFPLFLTVLIKMLGGVPMLLW